MHVQTLDSMFFQAEPASLHVNVEKDLHNTVVLEGHSPQRWRRLAMYQCAMPCESY